MVNPVTIQEALRNGKSYLSFEQTDALRSAEILLQHVLQITRSYLYTHSEQALSAEQLQQYQTLLHQRQQGMPIAYLIGQRSFWSFELKVSPATLIPRAETELLIERILAMTDAHLSYTVLDLGTGTGAIALALAAERPHWKITACDHSEPALLVAQENAHHLQLPVQFVQSDWLQAFGQQTFDIIVANPPYLAIEDPHLHQGDLRFEPPSALVSGQDGLQDLRIIITQSYTHLNPHGWLVVEHGYDQSEAVHDLFQQQGYQNIQSWSDWQGHPRVCSGLKGHRT